MHEPPSTPRSRTRHRRSRPVGRLGRRRIPRHHRWSRHRSSRGVQCRQRRPAELAVARFLDMARHHHRAACRGGRMADRRPHLPTHRRVDRQHAPARPRPSARWGRRRRARTRASFPRSRRSRRRCRASRLATPAGLSDDDEKRASLQALSHRLSHQLRTPLSVLRLRVDDLADDHITGERRIALADVVATQIDRLDQLGGDLAELDPRGGSCARIHSTSPPSPRLWSNATHRSPARGGVSIAFAGRTGAPDSTVIGDVAVLDDAIANVVPERDQVHASGRTHHGHRHGRGGAAFITVRDTGAGIGASSAPTCCAPACAAVPPR